MSNKSSTSATSSKRVAKPAYDPEMAAFLDVYPAPKDITRDFIPLMRQAPPSQATADDVLAGEPYTHEERQVNGHAGPVTISIFRPTTAANAGPVLAGNTKLPVLYYTHGGGFLCGNRFTSAKEFLQFAKAAGAILVTVEYRLTPEHPYPAAIDDAWAGLKYVGSHASELGMDPDRLMLVGSSAGANLTAALALIARDQQGPKIVGQLLDCPMLDDRNSTTSSKQFVGEGTWSRDSNIMAWGIYLGPNAGRDGVSQYAAPARCTDLSDLPPSFISVGSCEVFRDECVAYASNLWKAGVQCELHVWPGGFHVFDGLVPTSPISVASIEAKSKWVKNMLARQVKAKL
ncbi:alpha/beta hydrolase fold domain-containing protein [Sarocladium implicatum]|nr:alpha/beta hydrolase fold domain-containing protein [Sarocladium implicatum]